MDAIIDADRTARRRGGALALIALFALLLLAGCGGSGSSGFDALAAENDAIDRALQGGSCPVENGLTICASNQMPSSPMPSATRTPTGTPEAAGSATPTRTGTAGPAVTRTATSFPSATPTPTQLPPGRPSAEVDFSPNDIANCAGTDLSEPCVLTVTFAVSNAPANAVYRAASRERDPDSVWTLHASPGPYAFIAVAPDVATIQVAVLLFDGDPGELPASVELLADSGAQVAFVTEPVDVRAPTP